MWFSSIYKETIILFHIFIQHGSSYSNSFGLYTKQATKDIIIQLHVHFQTHPKNQSKQIFYFQDHNGKLNLKNKLHTSS